jgi:hypothetical protein
MYISFAWTLPALQALRKTCTRRNWSDDYAARFHKDQLVDAYGKSPRNGGKKVGVIRLTCEPYKESTSRFPASDYEVEGFKWMEEQGLFIQGLTPMEFCQDWINANEDVWIIRFKPVILDTTCTKDNEK